MESPRLLLVNSTSAERERIEHALRKADMAPWVLTLRAAESQAAGNGHRPEAAIVCGSSPERAVTTITEAYGDMPILVLARSDNKAERSRLAESGVATVLSPREIDSLPDHLRRALSPVADTNASAATSWTKSLLDAAVAASQDLIIVCDAAEQRLITCNPAVQAMLGYTQAELIGDTIESLFPDREAFEEFSAFLGESLQRWGRCDTALQLVHRDGDIVDVSMHVTALPPGLGLDDWIIGTIKDISGLRDAERAVSETREHLESTLDSLQDGVITVDPESRTILTCNPAIETIFGYAPRELIGSPTEKFFPDKATYEQVGEDYARALESQSAYRRELTMPHKDGHSVNVEMTISALSETLGWRQGIVVSFRDVTRQKKAEKRARLAESVLKNTVEAVMITDLDHRIVDVNPAFERLTGYTAAEVIGNPPDILRSGRHDSAFYRRIREELEHRGSWQGEIWHRRKDGTIFPSMASTSVLRDEAGNITHHCGIFTDISHHKHVQERLEYLTRFDTLTGLPNRASFEELIEEAVQRSAAGQYPTAVFFLDIDHFKTVNETLGHSAGDQLLREAAERLSQPLKPSDELARLGGDEFGIIARGLSNPRDATALAKQLLDQFQEPFSLEGRDIYASVSIGISLVPEDEAMDAEDSAAAELAADRDVLDVRVAGREPPGVEQVSRK
jgi:diguanylate cyclase (GGDEF)-like protein/PAS domain S-box-containing protein